MKIMKSLLLFVVLGIGAPAKVAPEAGQAAEAAQPGVMRLAEAALYMNPEELRALLPGARTFLARKLREARDHNWPEISGGAVNIFASLSWQLLREAASSQYADGELPEDSQVLRWMREHSSKCQILLKNICEEIARLSAPEGEFAVVKKPINFMEAFTSFRRFLRSQIRACANMTEVDVDFLLRSLDNNVAGSSQEGTLDSAVEAVAEVSVGVAMIRETQDFIAAAEKTVKDWDEAQKWWAEEEAIFGQESYEDTIADDIEAGVCYQLGDRVIYYDKQDRQFAKLQRENPPSDAEQQDEKAEEAAQQKTPD